MKRSTWIKAATFSAALGLVAPSFALACEAHEKAATEKAAAQKATPAKADTKAGEDALHADKCDCSGPADCTCKKGKCKCAKCKKRHDKAPESKAEV